ncbi:hypothetical protein DPMN_001465 [Dreissena polymorpha]|uniref:Uncharacterized protein n=1 Tax=Dreissena polymorpha TaxID=45954 RepID=A0A9D4RSY1_DREPO|nr:hypothetical protein DPMN_001465 [Dreissena polymorpha]
MQYWIEQLRDLQDIGSFSGDFLDRSLVQFCFLALIQDELDLAFQMWNNHHIRRASNSNVPFGRPEQMYRFPPLWSAKNHIVAITKIDMAACCRESEFR